MENTYKAKYLQLKSQYMNAVDTAFRLGFEQGKQQAELDQVAQQQQAAQEMAMQAASAPPPGAEGGAPDDGSGGPPDAESAAPDAGAPGEAASGPMQESEHPDGTELDQHIAKLESLLGKSEVAPDDLAKALSEIKALRKSQVQAIELKKSAQAIKEISKALHRPGFKLSVQASHNMSDTAKRAVSLQHKIVDNVMQKWEEEEMKATKGIHQIISVEGLSKKE